MSPPSLRAGIFAAGFGLRLGGLSGPARRPKGLTPVGGRPLIDWILEALDAAGVSETVMIINEQSIALRDHVGQTRRVQWIVETTPSSMHSFLRVVEELGRGGDEGPFLISTVDTIAPAGTFRTFVDLADRVPPADMVMALTTRIEDENPLRVDIDERNPPEGGSHRCPVTSDFGNPPEGGSHRCPVASDFSRTARTAGPVLAIGSGRYATAGYYFVRSSVLREAAAGRAANFGALRVFFRHLFDRGYRLTGVCMPESVDVDRPSDVEAAEHLLRAGHGVDTRAERRGAKGPR